MPKCYLILVQVYRRTLDGFSTRPKKLAVNGITLNVPKGECFGVLGVNGKIHVYMYVCTYTNTLVEEHIFIACVTSLIPIVILGL